MDLPTPPTPAVVPDSALPDDRSDGRLTASFGWSSQAEIVRVTNRHTTYDLSPFHDTSNAIDGLAASAKKICDIDTHDVADIITGFHVAPALNPLFPKPSEFHDRDYNTRSLSHLPDELGFLWDQNTARERFGIDPLEDSSPSLTGTCDADTDDDQCRYLCLQDAELHNIDRDQYATDMQLSGYGDAALLGFEPIETSTQYADTVASKLVSQPLHLPSRHIHGRRQSRHERSGDDRSTRSGPRSRSNAIIRDWYFKHSSSPYPSPDEIAALTTSSRKSKKQVKTCLSNLRARSKPGHRISLTSSQITPHDGTTHVMDIDSLPSYEYSTIHGLGTAAMNSNESWDDAMQIEANHFEDIEGFASPPFCPANMQFQSLAYMEDNPSAPPLSKRKGRRQHPSRFYHAFSEANSSSPQTSSDNRIDAKKPYHCTVCRKSFKDVYGWKRHESSVHGYSDIEWVCMLSGYGMPGQKCVFCSDTINDFRHFEEHDVKSCLDKNICDRTFSRKDLLKQHVQQIHLATADDSVSRSFRVPKAWSQEVETARIKHQALWCGFCLTTCDSIEERMDHVAEHFRKGRDIEEWIPLTTT